MIEQIDFDSLSLTETEHFEEAVAEQVANVGKDTKIFLFTDTTQLQENN